MVKDAAGGVEAAPHATGSKVCLLQPPPHLSGCRESQGLISLVPSEAKMGHRRKDAFPVSGGAALT